MTQPKIGDRFVLREGAPGAHVEVLHIEGDDAYTVVDLDTQALYLVPQSNLQDPHEAIRRKARLSVVVHELADEVDQELEELLAPAISDWKAKEPPACGHAGGWAFKSIVDNPLRVELRHDCFTAHPDGRDATYATVVPLYTLLAGGPR